MKKICVFCETWASGGIESFLCKLFTGMDLEGLQIDLVTTQIQESVFTPALESCGIRVRQLSGSKGRWPSNCLRFFRLLKAENYDVVHLNAFQGLQLIYLWLATCAGVPVRIAHSHGSDLRKSRLRSCKLLLHKTGRLLFERYATERWACSGAAAAFLFHESTAARFIPNGIDTERFLFRPEARRRIREELGLANAFVIGSVGRLVAEKNHRFLLDVLAALLPHRPESVLLLAGDGEARQELQRKAETLDIAGHVIFHGVSQHVEELLWAMDAFAFPSLFEGLGLAAVEAQAAGLPVLCSEHVPEETGLTPDFRRVPLTEGENAWAQALLNTKCGSRENAADWVRQAGFEMSAVSEAIRTAYLTGHI